MISIWKTYPLEVQREMISRMTGRRYNLSCSHSTIKRGEFHTCYNRGKKRRRISGRSSKPGQERVFDQRWSSCRSNLTHLKLPVRSETPGRNTVSAKKFAPLDTNFRFRSQPYTPPGPSPTRVESPDEVGKGVEEYRVPVTMSRLWSFCCLSGD